MDLIPDNHHAKLIDELWDKIKDDMIKLRTCVRCKRDKKISEFIERGRICAECRPIIYQPLCHRRLDYQPSAACNLALCDILSYAR